MNPDSHQPRPRPRPLPAPPLPPFPRHPFPTIQQLMRFHPHSPTLDVVIEALYRADGIGSTAEAVRLVDALRPPMECVTMGDLFAHVDDEEMGGKARRREVEQEQEQEQEQKQEHQDSCEICGVRCMEMAYPPYPGLCARCTVKVQMVQREKTKGAQDDED